MNSQPIFGEVLRNIRTRKKMTQKQFADRAGLSSGTISRFENGHESPHLYTVEQIIHKFDLDDATSRELISAAHQQPSASFAYPSLNIPKLSSGSFRGRSAEIDQLKNWITDKSKNAQSVMVISGIPGIGKSTLVARVLEENSLPYI